MIRRVARILMATGLSATAACSSVMTGLVGDPHGPQGTPKTAAPTPFMGLAYSSNNVDAQAQSQSHVATGTQTILPPTLAPTSPADTTEDTEAVGTAGPRPPIAVAPLTQDPSQLGGLGSAAAREAKKAGQPRFVLLVLTPALSDAAAINAIGTQSRAAAQAALHAIAAAGVPADRVEISSATAIAGAPGEMRLYVR
ncbi:MAG TPA: hypothetical protein VKZ79_18140 [Alphaproteobacteria bacterium]|nr:hypothetical protein [Alphaproteobacteria bacterium]